MVFESGVELLLILLLLRSSQALIGVFGLVRGGVSILDTHVMNTVCPLCPEVSGEDIPIHISLVL